MRAVFRFFMKRWVLSLLGFIMLGLLIWFVGPLFAFAGRAPLEPVNNRIIAIVLVITVWLLNKLIRFLWAQIKSKDLLDAILGQKAEVEVTTDAKVAASEVEFLQENIHKAVDVLKKDKKVKYRGSQFLYKLPWYLLIGPPGSGKTTAVTTSGLRLLITDKKGRGRELPGVHGTRYCDWFFTDEAVLVDTAGRYTTQDSRPEVDSAAWIGFLGLLKKYRKRRPINGVVVCVSLPQIADQPAEKTMGEANDIRLRLRELHEHLKIRFPIYFVFTKCDLLAGFIEFFSDLDKEGRQQVWGVTFPLESTTDNVVDQFVTEFGQLEAQLNKRVSMRLQQEKDPNRRAMIYAFPKQFGALRELASQFLNETFLSTRYETAVMLRGVYFTSGTQQGSPLDRLMGSLARSFSLAQMPNSTLTSKGKSYFLTRFFRRVVFAEAGLANTDFRWERRRLWIQRGLIGFSAILVGILILGWFVSFVQNQSYLHSITERSQSVQLQIDNLTPEQNRLQDILPILNSIRETPGGYVDETELLHTISQLGLDQQEEFGSKSKIVYQRLLKSLYLPRMMIRIENRLKDTSISTEEMLEILRVYLMLVDPVHFNKDTVIAWLHNDLKKAEFKGGKDPQQNIKLIAHAEALFANGPVKPQFEQDENLVNIVRARLTGITLADRVFSSLLNDAAIWRGINDFRVVNEVGRDFYTVFSGKSKMLVDAVVDKRYTYAGFERFRDNVDQAIEDIEKDSWVLEKPDTTVVESEKIREQISSRYYKEFTEHWFSFLNELTIVSFDGNLQKAVDVLQIITRDNSLFEKLLAAVERETTLKQPEKFVDEKLKENGWNISGSARAFKDKVVQLFDDRFPEFMKDSSFKMDAVSVEAVFSDMHKLVRAREEGAPPIREILGQLKKLEQFLTALLEMREQQVVEQVLAIQDSELGRFGRYVDDQPEPVARWLSVIDGQISRALSEKALAYLNEEWQADVWGLYKNRLRGRYPLVRKSNDEIALADFGEFFGPAGVLDQFYNEYLKDLVDTRRRPWRLEPNSPIHISRETLIALQRADTIRKVFFSKGDKFPFVSFTMTPISMDMSINEFFLNLDGQELGYDQTATRPRDVQWPGTGSGRVQIQISPPPVSSPPGVTINGSWAWFRLLDRSAIKSGSGAGMYDITFSIGGKQVTYELRTHSLNNPFRSGSLKAFRCPELL